MKEIEIIKINGQGCIDFTGNVACKKTIKLPKRVINCEVVIILQKRKIYLQEGKGKFKLRNQTVKIKMGSPVSFDWDPEKNCKTVYIDWGFGWQTYHYKYNYL